jgi:hypothetical protein
LKFAFKHDLHSASVVLPAREATTIRPVRDTAAILQLPPQKSLSMPAGAVSRRHGYSEHNVSNPPFARFGKNAAVNSDLRPRRVFAKSAISATTDEKIICKYDCRHGYDSWKFF